MRYPIFAAFVLLLFYYPAFCQSTASVTTNDSMAAQRATTTFLQAIRLQKEIYNGPEHIAYLPTIEGFAYFITSDWLRGSVQYDGVVYRDEELHYDLVKDKLIVKRPDGFPVELRSEKIDWFALPGHYFVYAPGKRNGLQPGIYEQLTQGALTLLAKHQKDYQERIEETKLQQKFVEETTYYAIENQKSHSIKSLHALLDLMDKRGNGVQQQLRKQGIKYRKNPAAALTAAAEYFNKTQP